MSVIWWLTREVVFYVGGLRRVVVGEEIGLHGGGLLAGQFSFGGILVVLLETVIALSDAMQQLLRGTAIVFQAALCGAGASGVFASLAVGAIAGRLGKIYTFGIGPMRRLL